MSKKKWLMLIALGMALCCMLTVVFIGHFLGQCDKATDYSVPVYTFQQSSSVHRGYRHTTLSSGNAVYVNDYDEYVLQLENTDPTQIIGRAKYGDGKICAIPGQKPTAYVAADVGSEMPSYDTIYST
jgi:hypothetical protein